MRIEEDIKLDFKDVLIRPKRSSLSSRKDVQLYRKFKFKHSLGEYFGIPIIVANMDHTGTMQMADAVRQHGLGVALHKFHSQWELDQYFTFEQNTKFGAMYHKFNPHTWLSIGTREEDAKLLDHYASLMAGASAYVCIDVANGYTQSFVDAVARIRAKYPRITIMAGNVVTPEMTEQLIFAGADVVKVGIGPGSVCTTRKMTGVGYPQLSAIIECADAAHGIGGLVCADGGIQVAGDLGKAFGAGADFVMCGGLFAGHDECRGSVIGIEKEIRQDIEVFASGDHNTRVVEYRYTHPDGTHVITNDPNTLPSKFFVIDKSKATMKFRGMSSLEAMQEHYGSKANYRASEGKSVEVPYKGPVQSTVEELLGGLRSTCTYVGAGSLKELSKRTTFVRVSRQLNDLFS